MELSKYCVDHGSIIAIKAFIANISPDNINDIKRYVNKGRMTKEINLQFGSLSYDIIEAFINHCIQNKIEPDQVKITKI